MSLIISGIKQGLIEETTTLSFTAPGYGTSIIQVMGSGTIASIVATLGNTSGTYLINGGNTLSNSAIYEFGLTLNRGDVISSINGATLIRLLFVWNG